MGTRYVERPSLRGARIAVGLLVVLLLVTYGAVVRDGSLRPSDLALAPVLALLALPFVALAVGRRRYSAILLTDTELVVGRARLPAEGLRLVAGGTRPSTPLLGGAFAPPHGWQTVVVEGADGRQWRIATRRPQELAAALSAARQGPAADR